MVYEDVTLSEQSDDPEVLRAWLWNQYGDAPAHGLGDWNPEQGDFRCVSAGNVLQEIYKIEVL